MDGPALREYAGSHVDILESSGLEHFLCCFSHVLSHTVFVVAKLVMKAQSRNSPFVFHDWVEIDIIFITRQYFAERAHADVGTLVLADFFFEGSTKAVPVRALREHSGAAAAFESVASNKLRMFFRKIAETSQVKATRPSVVKCGRLADKVRGLTNDTRPHNVLAEIVTHVST